MASIDFSKRLAAKPDLDRTQGDSAKHSSSYHRLVPPSCRTEATLTSSQCCNCSAYRELPQYTRGTDKSLARPGRKQARKHVRDASNFNDIEMRAVIKFFFFFNFILILFFFFILFPARQGAKGNSCHSDRNISLFPSLSG